MNHHAPDRRMSRVVTHRAAFLVLALLPGLTGATPGGAGADPLPVGLAAEAWPSQPQAAPDEAPVLRLEDLVQRGLSRDPQVRSAHASRQASEQRVAQMTSRRWPVAGMSVINGRGRERDQNVELQRRTERVDATLRWNLFNGGSDEAEIGAARLEALAAELDWQRAREEVAERLVEAALDLARLDRQLPASLQRLDAVQALVAQVRRQTELGRLAEIDLQQAISSWVDARLAHDQLLAEREGARLKLSHLAGEPVGGLAPFSLAEPAATTQQAQGPELVNRADAPDGPAAMHPGVQAARHRAQAARARVRPVETLAAPRVDLDLNRRLSDHTSPQLSSEQRQGWQVGVRWEMPLGGETVARRHETVYRAEAAEAEADRVAQVTVAEWVSLAPRIASAERSIGLLQRQIDQSQQFIRAGEVQFEAGRRGVQQLIQLRDQRFNAEQRLADQLMRLDQARLKQLTLTGGLLRALSL